MLTKAPPEILSPEDLAYMSTLNERDRRWFLATKAVKMVQSSIPYINHSKTYDIKRTIEESYQKRLARQVIFAPELGQWNYLVKPAN